MASLQTIRETNFKKVLEDTHSQLRLKMIRNTNKKAAKELQDLLQEIKITARKLDENIDDPVALRLRNDYEDLITTAFKLQKVYHGTGSLKASTLFRRSSKTKTIAEADNIFEEDLAAIISAGEFLGGNTDVNLSYFLAGTKTASLKSLNILDKNINIEAAAIELINKLMDKENSRASRVAEIKSTTAKIDVQGNRVSAEYQLPLNQKIGRLMELMKDATFSAKQYTSYSWSEEKARGFSDIGLQLGNTNLYKAITGSLSEIYSSPKTQQHIFFRGMNTLLRDSHGYAKITEQHFSHLRFIYELRGSGLLDENGRIKNVKYIIYNDPSSDAIFVRDTASIIINALDSSYRNSNLFGTVYLSASQVQSK